MARARRHTVCVHTRPKTSLRALIVRARFPGTSTQWWTEGRQEVTEPCAMRLYSSSAWVEETWDMETVICERIGCGWFLIASPHRRGIAPALLMVLTKAYQPKTNGPASCMAPILKGRCALERFPRACSSTDYLVYFFMAGQGEKDSITYAESLAKRHRETVCTRSPEGARRARGVGIHGVTTPSRITSCR